MWITWNSRLLLFFLYYIFFSYFHVHFCYILFVYCFRIINMFMSDVHRVSSLRQLQPRYRNLCRIENDSLRMRWKIKTNRRPKQVSAVFCFSIFFFTYHFDKTKSSEYRLAIRIKLRFKIHRTHWLVDIEFCDIFQREKMQMADGVHWAFLMISVVWHWVYDVDWNTWKYTIYSHFIVSMMIQRDHRAVYFLHRFVPTIAGD